MKTITHVLKDPSGLHARIASTITTEANRWKSNVTIVTRGVRSNATDMMGLMLLDVREGERIEIVVEGEDEDRAAKAFEGLVIGL